MTALESTAECGGNILEDFWQNLPLPAYIIDRGRGLYLANQALAETFGYRNTGEAEEALESGHFLSAHFGSEASTGFFELLNRKGRVANWLMSGETLAGRPLSLEITAWGGLRVDGRQLSLKAVFLPPGEVRDVLREKACLVSEQAEKAKHEFLANINHEFRTPLNIIIGMLALALEDESLNDELRVNLALAKDGADHLFDIVNDLIDISNLEGGRLTNDMAVFSPFLLLQNLTRKFEGQARARKVSLCGEGGDNPNAVLEGGFNFLLLALGKLVHNAIKFVDEGRGEAVIRAVLEDKGEGLRLACTVLDNGPGLNKGILESQELFRQGDGSMIRKHGGLGLGLKLTKNLVAALGGQLKLVNRPEGGAEFSFSVPVKMIEES